MSDQPATARCHCGTVQLSFVMAGGLDGLRRCDCSLCRRVKPGAVTARLGDLTVAAGEEFLTLYQFGTKTAKHWFCSRCGTHTHHQRRSNPNEFGINIGCVDGLPARTVEAAIWVDGVNHPSDKPEQGDA